jgi:hypothetical protein
MKQFLYQFGKFRSWFVLLGVVGILLIAGSLSAEGSPPLIYWNPDPVNEGDEVTFSTIVTYDSYKWWKSDGPGNYCTVTDSPASEEATYTYTFYDTGDWQVCFEGIDSSAVVYTDAQIVTVNNLPPLIDDPFYWTATPEPSVVGEAFHVEVPFTDYEESGYSCTVNYGDLTGEETGTITGPVEGVWTCVGPNHTYTTADMFSVQATVYDVVGDFPSYSTSDIYYHTVNEASVNLPPIALDYYAAYWSWPSIEPNDSVFYIPAIDPEGNPLTISYIETTDPVTEGIVGDNNYYYCDYMDKCWVSFYIIPPTGVTAGGSMNITFQYRVNDGTSDSNTATITLSFGNDIPNAYESHQLAAKNDTTIIKMEGDGSAALTFHIVRQPAHGSVGVPTGVSCEQWGEEEDVGYFCTAGVDYTPVTDFEGEDSFAFVAYNGSAYSQQQEVRLWVAPNSAPTAITGTATVSTVQPSTIVLEATDPDWIMATPDFWNMHDDLAFVIDTPPTNGTLGIPSDSYCEGILVEGLDYDLYCRSAVQYTPNEGTEATTDSFTFHVNDSHLDSDPVTVSLTLRAPQTFTVNAIDDVVDASGCDSTHCSLREAVQESLNEDTIEFSLTYPATITLTDHIEIYKSIRIVGPGADQLTISGGRFDEDSFDIMEGGVFIFTVSPPLPWKFQASRSEMVGPAMAGGYPINLGPH